MGQTIKLPIQRLDATLAASEANREERTVPMTFYAGATVLQFNWEHGMHQLRLSMDPKAIRLGRLNSGRAPFLNSHSSYSVSNVLGVIKKGSVELEGNDARARVRFSKRAEIEPIFQDVLDGVLCNVSVGAKIHKLKEVTKEDDKIKTFVALDWEPTEVSLVAIGADPGAHFTGSVECSECEIELAEAEAQPLEETAGITRKETDVEENTVQNSGADARIDKEAQQAAALAERTRVMEISKLAAKYGMTELATQHIESGANLAEFQSAVLAAISEREMQTNTTNHVTVARDQAETRLTGLRQALLDRAGIEPVQADQPGYQFCNLVNRPGAFIAILEEFATDKGLNPRTMSRDDLIKFGMYGTSDLPLLMAATSDHSLRAGYAKMSSEWKKIAARRSVPNFKLQYEMQVDLQATFPQVPESGEYQVATLVEGRESYRIYTYANKLAVTRQMIINDDLGAITDIPMKFGMKAAMREAQLFWTLVLANPALSDGVAVFATGHNNLITSSGTAISVDSLGAMRLKMRAQTDISGDTIDLMPKYMVVSAAKEQLARQYLSNAYNPTAQTSINPWTSIAELIVEPRLDAASVPLPWYMFADPAIAPVFVYAYLQGNEGVFSQSETTIDVDGFKWLARFDFGVGAVDFRGAVKNDGA